jgi:hypothetical protein
MAKRSAAHQATVDCLQSEQREKLAYHFILSAIVTGENKGSKWGSLKRVGSVYACGDTWIWQITFTPRMVDGVIMETFTTKDGDETIRCFYLADLYRTYANRSFDSGDILGKFQDLYWRAVEMERVAQNAAVLGMVAAN